MAQEGHRCAAKACREMVKHAGHHHDTGKEARSNQSPMVPAVIPSEKRDEGLDPVVGYGP